MNIGEILTYTLLGNTGKEYLTALLVFAVGVLILKIFKNIVIKKLIKIADHTKTEIDDIVIRSIDAIHWPFYVILAFYISTKFIQVSQLFAKILNYIILIVLTFYAILFIQHLIEYSSSRFIAKRKADETVLKLLAKILKVSLWFIAVILILSNLGYKVSTLIAGLSIGGIAIALALQNILTDLFASFSIYFDKPFQVGDFIIIGKDLGVVKKIGIKTTRIACLWGQEIVISNKELTETRVNNYKKMEKRRVHFPFGVVYSTPTKKLKQIPAMVKEIFDKIEFADLDRIHFKEFGDFSLNYEVAYYISTGDYNIYMDIQQEINLALKERFEKEKIEFAYPTQTIYVNKQ